MQTLHPVIIEFIPEGVEPLVFAVQLAFAFIAATIILLEGVRKRDVGASKVPVFSKWYLLKDNLFRIAIGAAIMWALTYFSAYFLDEETPKMTRYGCGFIIGLFNELIWRSGLKRLKQIIAKKIEAIGK